MWTSVATLVALALAWWACARACARALVVVVPAVAALARDAAVAVAVVFPCACVAAAARARRMRVGTREGEMRRLRGDADPLAWTTTRGRRVCVVGAGASGLCATREALRRGFDVRAYERSDSVGGVWAYGHASGKVFNNVIQNVTKMCGVFADYPAPERAPPYLGWEQTMEYLTGYCTFFNLEERIAFNAEVVRVERDESTGEFEVTIEDARARTSPKKDRSVARRVERFDYVWVASGQLTTPAMPDIPGLDTFLGTVIHSVDYKVPTQFVDRNVLVIGLGSASGSDIAQELTWVARSVSLSVRTERTIFSRGFRNGMATMLNRISWIIPAWLGVVMFTYFDVYPFVHHPKPGVTDSGDLLTHIAHQKIKRVGLVDRVQSDTVYFRDGTSGKYDAIMLATGYKREFNFMAKNLQPVESGLFEDCILPTDPRVGYILFVLPFGSHWQVAELQATLLARVHDGTIPLPSRETMAKLANKFDHVSHHEHFAEYWKHKYLFILAPYIFPKLETLIRHPLIALRIAWSPWITPVGEWASDKDRTRYGAARGIANVRWNGSRINRW